MNLKANALPTQLKSLDIDKAPKLGLSKDRIQPTEFNNIFGKSVSELAKSQALGQAVTHHCASGECNPLLGQSLPQSGENLPILEDLSTPIETSVLTDEIINTLNTAPGQENVNAQNITSELDGAVAAESIIPEQASNFAVSSINTEVLTGIEPGIIQAEKAVLTKPNEGLPSELAKIKPVSLHESELISSPLDTKILPANVILPEPSVANSVIESLAGKTVKNTNIDARNIPNHNPVSSMPIAAQPQGQGTGQQSNMDNLGQQNLSLTDMPVAQAESKVDFSQLLEKAPGITSKDGAAIESALVASKLSANVAPKLATTATETFQLQQSVNKPGWSEELGSRLVWLSKEGVQEAKIRLTPANMGTIDIRISVENDQAKVSFLSQHSAVRDIIEGSLPRLREMMMEAGVKLEHANVGSQSNNSEKQNQSHLQNEDKDNRFSAEQQELVEQGGHELLIATEDSALKGVDYYA